MPAAVVFSVTFVKSKVVYNDCAYRNRYLVLSE